MEKTIIGEESEKIFFPHFSDSLVISKLFSTSSDKRVSLARSRAGRRRASTRSAPTGAWKRAQACEPTRAAQSLQCYQMARLLFNIGPFITMEFSPNLPKMV